MSSDKVSVRDEGTTRILAIERPESQNCVDGETAQGIAETIQAFAEDERFA